MNLFTPSILLLSILLGACVNSPSQLLSSEYAESCHLAERSNDLNSAEKQCYLALANTESSNNPKLRSLRLYKLGKIRLQLAKFHESELLLKESLNIEESLGSSPKTIGSRLIDLSASLAEQGRWQEGAILLERLLPIASQFSKLERARIGQLLIQYSRQLKSLNQAELAKRFKATASIIVDNDTYFFRTIK